MSPDDGVPEPIDRPSEATGEISGLPPEEAQKVRDEIRAIAEQRGEDLQPVEPSEPSPATSMTTMRSRRSTQLPPIPITIQPGVEGSAPTAAPDDEALVPDELRDAWPLLDLEERADGLRVLPREDAEDFFVSLSAADQSALLLHFRPGQRRQWMRMLEPDDVADVIQQVGEAHKQTLLGLLDAPTRKEVLALLAYEEDQAGGLMSTRYARLRPQMSAGEAILYLQRRARENVETIYYAYALDNELRLLGVVSFRDLFGSDPKKTVAEIMETDVVRVTDEMDQETVSRIFADNDLTVVPVVDKDGKMKGIVTVDDIVDVVQEEATEDAQKFGGLEALEVPYLESSRREMIRKRGRWLMILLVGEMLTTTAMGFFEHELIAVLALFLPLIVSSGGNSGSQASTLVVRAMALGEVRASDWWLVLRREVIIGLSLGAILAALAMLRVMIWGVAGAYDDPNLGSGHYFLIAGTVGAAVTGCVMWGSLSGAMLPFLLRKIGADPANASAPLVATLVDVSGIVIYFTCARLILTGVLL